MLFADMKSYLASVGYLSETRVESVLEVGCSLGYLLRYLETDVFLRAAVFHGVDIDQHAIADGTAALASVGSKVRLRLGDMVELSEVVGDRKYDVVICVGVLMYLHRAAATQVVQAMLERASWVAILGGLAEPESDPSARDESRVRVSDGTFVHNLDRMVEAAGGKVVYRRWEPRKVHGYVPYWVFAHRPRAGPTAGRPTPTVADSAPQG